MPSIPISGATKADKSTTVTGADGLTGGGDLSANRTITMPDVGTAGVYGSQADTLVVTTDSKGRVSGVTVSSIQIAESQVTDLTSDLSSINSSLGTLASYISGLQSSKADKTISITGTNGLSGGGDLSASRTLSPVYGATANTVTEGNDPRLSDSRPPTGPAGGDLDGSTYPNPVLSKWQTNPIALSLPQLGQVPTWNGSAWVPGAPATGGSGGGGRVYFFDYGAAAVAPITGLPAGTKRLDTTLVGGPASLTSATLPTGGTFATVASFVTEPNDPDTTLLPAGLWDFNIWASSPSATPGAVLFRLTVYKYNGTTTTPLLTTESVYLYVPTVVKQYTVSAVIPQTVLLLTDRIYIEIEASAVSAGQTITVSFDDATPSHTHTTIPTVTGTGIVHVLNGVVQSPASPVNLTAGPTEVTGTLPIANGGTGLSTAPTNGQLLIGNGTGYTQSTLTAGSGISITNGAGTITITNTNAGVSTFSGGTTGLTPATPTSGAITLGGTLNVANGGTGLTSAGGVANRALYTADGTSFTTGQLPNAALANSSITVSPGTGLTGGGAVALGGTTTLSIANTGVVAAAYGSASAVGTFTVNAQGQLTTAATTPIAISASQITSGTLSLPISLLIISGATAQSITAPANTINPTTSYHRLNNTSGGNVTLTSTPTINWGAPVLGQQLLLQAVVGMSNNIVLQRGAATKLSLGGATRTLSAGATITLMWDGNLWVEIAFVSGTTAP